MATRLVYKLLVYGKLGRLGVCRDIFFHIATGPDLKVRAREKENVHIILTMVRVTVDFS